jgi:hypothetical protein
VKGPPQLLRAQSSQHIRMKVDRPIILHDIDRFPVCLDLNDLLVEVY